jgi:hypothetical protein
MTLPRAEWRSRRIMIRGLAHLDRAHGETFRRRLRGGGAIAVDAALKQVATAIAEKLTKAAGL